MNSKNSMISVIYSFYNEEEVLDELIKRTVSTLDAAEIAFEIIFVNDSSTDNSQSILENHASRDERVKVIQMSGNFGQTQCIVAGLNYAKGSAAVYLDSDLQDPPELIPKLHNKWKEGAEVVLTKRIKRKGENPLKMFLTKLGYLFWKKASKVKMNIECGDFVLLDQKVYRRLGSISEEDPFLRGLVAWLGYKQTIVEYERDARFAGETHFSFWGGNPIETFFIGLSSFSIFPLYISFIFSFLFMIMSVASLLIFFPESILFSSMMFGFSAILFCMGILGIYIARIHFQSRNRKLYNIDSKINIS